MSTLIFVLVFVGLGLGVLFVAMSGGPGGIGATMHSQSRGSRRFSVVAFVVALIVLGFAIPAAVIALDKDNDDIPHASVTNLTPAEARGRELFGRRCSLCHSLAAANAVAPVGPNLDDLSPPKALVLDAINHGRSRGNGQMPAQIYTGQDAQDVAAFVAKAVGSSGPSGG
jgi:mono/diheme cytochrome c family protein